MSNTFVLSETCDDEILNQDEEEIDCGGSCPACPGSFIKLKSSLCIFFALETKRWYYFSNYSLFSSILVDCEWGEFTCSGSTDAFCSKDGSRTCTRSKITEAENNGKECEELNDSIIQECKGTIECLIIAFSWRSIYSLVKDYLIASLIADFIAD